MTVGAMKKGTAGYVYRDGKVLFYIELGKRPL